MRTRSVSTFLISQNLATCQTDDRSWNWFARARLWMVYLSKRARTCWKTPHPRSMTNRNYQTELCLDWSSAPFSSLTCQSCQAQRQLLRWLGSVLSATVLCSVDEKWMKQCLLQLFMKNLWWRAWMSFCAVAIAGLSNMRQTSRSSLLCFSVG